METERPGTMAEDGWRRDGFLRDSGEEGGGSLLSQVLNVSRKSLGEEGGLAWFRAQEGLCFGLPAQAHVHVTLVLSGQSHMVAAAAPALSCLRPGSPARPATLRGDLSTEAGRWLWG